MAEECNAHGYVPFLRNIGLIMTYKCQASCPHCILEAGPGRNEEISLDDAFHWIEQAAAYRDGYIRMLSLTGGEPFYDIDRLYKISSFAQERGLLVSAVTNALWAETLEVAAETLSMLSSIKMISLSTDAYHQEFVPLERVMNALRAAKELGINCNIHICTVNEHDQAYLETINRLKEVVGKESIATTITFPLGRATNKLDLSGYRVSANPPLSACSSSSSPVIYPDGKVIACCGALTELSSAHPLELGCLRKNTLQEILDNAELNPILHAMRIWGPQKLIALAHDAGLTKYLPDRYIDDSICYACYKVMSSAKLASFLKDLSREPDFLRKIAYARAYYFQETLMAERLINTKINREA